MAVIHSGTTLTPNKLELATAWLPAQPWYAGPAGSEPVLAKAGGFRLDDPQGEVGIEFMVVTDTAGDTPVTYQLPLTYRGAPLDGADAALVGTTEHGVLGKRWVYDGAHDPVLTGQLAALLLGRAEPQAQHISDTPDPTVTATLDPAAARLLEPLQVTETAQRPDATDLLLASAAAPAVLRIVRRLQAAGEGEGGEVQGGGEGGAAVAGSVTAPWADADGSTLRGAFALLLPAS